MIRVMIADDHNLVRQGIRALLEREEDVEVVAEAADGLETLENAFSLRPDVLVLDVGMPRLSGTQTLERLRQVSPNTQVVILSMYSDEALVRQALRGGARAYLLKNSIKEDLILAVRAAALGETYLNPTVSAVLEDGFLDRPVSASPLDALTAREREVMKLIAEGETNASIARLLHISVKTVEKHRAKLLAKLAVHDTAALVRLAVQYHLVFLDNHE
jgi:two-component system response regulator NreC